MNTESSKKVTPAKSKAIQKMRENRVNQLFKLDKITKDDVNNLSEEEVDLFSEKLTDMIRQAKGEALDRVLDQTDDVLAETTKNQMWEHNHYVITKAINEYIIEYGMPPKKNTLAENTGLSRRTIHKHLKEFETHPMYADIVQSFRLLKGRILSRLFRLAIDQCDVKAARLFLEATGGLQVNGGVNNQTNNIQINGVIFDAQSFNGLDPAQQLAILKIIQKPRVIKKK